MGVKIILREGALTKVRDHNHGGGGLEVLRQQPADQMHEI